MSYGHPPTPRGARVWSTPVLTLVRAVWLRALLKLAHLRVDLAGMAEG